MRTSSKTGLRAIRKSRDLSRIMAVHQSIMYIPVNRRNPTGSTLNSREEVEHASANNIMHPRYPVGQGSWYRCHLGQNMQMFTTLESTIVPCILKCAVMWNTPGNGH